MGDRYLAYAAKAGNQARTIGDYQRSLRLAYPCMLDHEIIGRVTKAGSAVTRHKAGDLVGVGCMINSCRKCEP